MRLVKVSAPEGKGKLVMATAFSVGISTADLRQITTYDSRGGEKLQDVIDLSTSTPLARNFVRALLESDYYNAGDYSLNTREPRSLLSSDTVDDLTTPLVVPITDIVEELWQFSHVTYGFAGRVLLASFLLSYGLIEQQILLIIAGLMFIPLLPVLLAVGVGAWTRNWKLFFRSLTALITAAVLLIAGGAIVGLIATPPLRYESFSSMGVSFLISLTVGIAAGLASVDDVGRREMIGLAATAQTSIIPAWFGICAAFGFPGTTSRNEIIARAGTFAVNVVTIIVASLATYLAQGAISGPFPSRGRGENNN
jgi:hypothetical protein